MNQKNRQYLRKLLSERFTIEELKALCWDIGVDYAVLQGNSKSGKVTSLLTHLDNRLSLVKALNWVELNRSDIELPTSLKIENNKLGPRLNPIHLVGLIALLVFVVLFGVLLRQKSFSSLLNKYSNPTLESNTEEPSGTASSDVQVESIPSPTLFIHEQISDDSYLLKGSEVKSLSKGDDLVVYGTTNTGTELPIAQVRVTALNPDSATAQVILEHPTIEIIANLRADNRINSLSTSELLPTNESVIGYLVSDGLIRIKPDKDIYLGDILIALEPNLIDGKIVDYIESVPPTHVRVKNIGANQQTIRGELVMGSWPVTGTLFLSLATTPVLTVPKESIRLATENEILILIAKFTNTSSSSRIDFQGRIGATLQSIIEKHSLKEVRIAYLEDTFSHEDVDEISDLGNLLNATMVIWGTYDDLGILPRVTQIKEDEQSISIEQATSRGLDLVNSSNNQKFLADQQLQANIAYWIQFILGQSYYINGEDLTALPLFTDAIQSSNDINKDDLKLSLSILHLYRGYVNYFSNQDRIQATDDFENAILNAKNLLETNVDTSIAARVLSIGHNNLGLVYLDQGFIDESILEFESAINYDAKFAVAFNNLGKAYQDNGDYQQALGNYSHAIEILPDYALAYVNRGVLFAELDSVQQAFDDYQLAVNLDPKDPVVYYNRGKLYFDENEPLLAISDYNRAISLDEEFGSAYTERGIANASIGEIEEALADFDKAVSLDTLNEQTFYNRAVANRRKGNLDAAIEDYNTAILLGGNDGDVYNGRGVAYGEKGEYALAVSDLSKAIELNPNRPEFFNDLGFTYSLMDDFENALLAYERAIELDHTFTDVYTNRGTTLAFLGRIEEAIADFRTYLQLEPNATNKNAVETYIEKLEASLEN